MSLVLIGLDHRSAPLDLRGRLAFTLDQLGPALGELRGQIGPGTGHPEVALLSTCNRTELYCAGAAPRLAEQAIDWLCGVAGLRADRLLEHVYLREDEWAARHALRVASGLDSMVLGETQILGQMKRAVREAQAAGTLGTTLHRLFQHAFSIAKDVRSRTEIGAHSVSLAAAAVRRAQQAFGDLSRSRVLFVGAGEMIELAATHFAAQRPAAMVVANRSAERGAALAARFGAQTLPLAELPQRMAKFDIVVSCTASAEPVIAAHSIAATQVARGAAPLLLVDLAVPRDIEAAAADCDGVTLLTIDDLAADVQRGGARRREAVAQAEAIVEAGVREFAGWRCQRDAVPLIRELQEQADTWRTGELERARKRLARGEDVQSVLDAMAQALTRKMLHGAMTELRGGHGEVSRLLERMFLRCPARLARPPGPTAAAEVPALMQRGAVAGDEVDAGSRRGEDAAAFELPKDACGVVWDTAPWRGPGQVTNMARQAPVEPGDVVPAAPAGRASRSFAQLRSDGHEAAAVGSERARQTGRTGLSVWHHVEAMGPG